MTTWFPELAERVKSQQTLQAALYGNINFDISPYRFTDNPAIKSALPEWAAKREPILQDEKVVELIRTATMLGDVVADPYASLVESYGHKKIIDMLKQACQEGVDSIPDAPNELRAFIASMENTPAWVDMNLIEEGARHLRIPAAFASPFSIRGAFLATFLNTYAALPMALTGALSGNRAAHRVNETASFFAATTLPDAMQRYGVGFEAAAMVRLMHSMVRYNALKRSDKWNAKVYGIPIPQVDQMPAGLINMFILAMRAKRQGRNEFSRRERAMLEFCRYRCFLLGLPEELLPTSPLAIVQVFNARAALLRDDFDDTCEALVRSTMAAYLRQNHSLFERVAGSVEKSWSKLFFLIFCGGNRKQAASMGVSIGIGDVLRAVITAPFLGGRFLFVQKTSQYKKLQGLMDKYTIHVLNKRLQTYGKPEYTTNVNKYPDKPGHQ